MSSQASSRTPSPSGSSVSFELMPSRRSPSVWSLSLLTIATLPVLALFLLLQRRFVRSIASTGVKG